MNGEIIGTIPTRFLPNGDYTLQLLAWDSQGNSSGMEVEFEYEETTDNKTGEIVLTEIIREEDTTIPVISGELKAAITNDGLSLTLTGTVADENLKEYTVVTGMADSENNPVSPVTLKTGTETIENATIVQYTYDKFEAGTYMIRVTAVYEAGNKRVMDFFTTVTVQGNIDDGYTGESGEDGEDGIDNSDSLNLVLSGTVADTGDTLKVYLTYPEEATDIRLTAEGAEVELYGRTAEISSDTPGEVDVTLTVTINGEEKSVTRTVRFFDPADNTHPKASFLTPEADSELKT